MLPTKNTIDSNFTKNCQYYLDTSKSRGAQDSSQLIGIQ